MASRRDPVHSVGRADAGAGAVFGHRHVVDDRVRREAGHRSLQIGERQTSEMGDRDSSGEAPQLLAGHTLVSPVELADAGDDVDARGTRLQGERHVDGRGQIQWRDEAGHAGRPARRGLPVDEHDGNAGKELVAKSFDELPGGLGRGDDDIGREAPVLVAEERGQGIRVAGLAETREVDELAVEIDAAAERRPERLLIDRLEGRRAGRAG